MKFTAKLLLLSVLQQDSPVVGKKRTSEEGSTQSSDLKRSRQDSLVSACFHHKILNTICYYFQASIDDISMDSAASMASLDNSDSVMSCSISESINIDKVSSSSGGSTVGSQVPPTKTSSQELSDSIGGVHSNDLNKKNPIKFNLKSI